MYLLNTGHFYYAWYSTPYAIEMQYHLEIKAKILTGAFACKHHVFVWNSNLSDQFGEQEIVCIGLGVFLGRSHNRIKIWVDKLNNIAYVSGKLVHI